MSRLITGTPVDTKSAALVGMWLKKREMPSTKPTPESTCTDAEQHSHMRRLARCQRTIET